MKRSRSDQDLSFFPSRFLEELFGTFEKRKVNYCVLRNYKDLPEKIGHDVDMLVARAHFAKAQMCVREVARKMGFLVVRHPRRYGYSGFDLTYFGSNYEHCDLHLDIWWMLARHGVVWLTDRYVLSRCLRYRNFYVPRQGVAAAVMLLKCSLFGGAIRDKYKANIQKACRDDSEEFVTAIACSLGRSTAKWLHDRAIHADWSSIDRAKLRLRQGFLLRAFTITPMVQLFRFAKHACWFVDHYFVNPTGCFVVFIGPDGSGKTSVAEGVQRDLEKIFTERAYYHGRFKVLPRLRVFKRFALRVAGKKDTKVEQKGVRANIVVYSPIRGSGYLAYYIWDYLFGHLLVWWARARGTIIVADRYYYDYAILGEWARLPRWLYRLLERLVPIPDVTVFLQSAPEEVWQRKRELPIEHIARQQQACREIARRVPGGCIVSGEQEMEREVREVAAAIIRRMAKRVSWPMVPVLGGERQGR